MNQKRTNRSSSAEKNWYWYSLEGRLERAIVQRTESGQSLEQTNRYFYDQSGIRVREEIGRRANGGAVVQETNIFLNDPQNLTMFPPVPSNLNTMLSSVVYYLVKRGGPGLTSNPNVTQGYNRSYDFRTSLQHQGWVHSDYWISPDVATHLRFWLQ